jgi:hypothetical protein
MQNVVVKNVKSMGDLSGLGLILALRSGDFFNSLVDPQAVSPLWK